MAPCQGKVNRKDDRLVDTFCARLHGHNEDMSGEEIGVAGDPGGYRSYEGCGNNDLLVGTTAEQQHQHYRSVEEDALDTMLETSVNELDEALKMGGIANYGTAASTTMPAMMAVDTANEPVVVRGGSRAVWALQPESPTTPSFPPPPSPLSSSLNRTRTTTPTKIEFLSSKNEPCQSVLLNASPLSSRPHDDEEAEVARFPAAAPLVPPISPSPAFASTVESKKSVATSSVAAPRSGRWTLDEKVLFLYGLQKYGRGKWKYIQSYCPGRCVFYFALCVCYGKPYHVLNLTHPQVVGPNQEPRPKGL
jgi:hypothetical protein